MYNIRFLAQITLTVKTPLKVGSNASDFLQDSPVQKDWNSLPMILGTSIAGVLRDKFETIFKSKTDDIFGRDDGSRLIISNALLVDEDGIVNEDLLLEKSKFLKIFDNLPIREHTVITDKGVSDNKFDEEVVYKGSKFKFEVEFISDGVEHQEWNNLLYILKDDAFRLGGGSTKGFGSFEDIEIKERVLNLDEKEDLQEYIEKSSSLNDANFKWNDFKKDDDNLYKSGFIRYELNINPDDFFMFGSGFGDSDADATPVYEKVVDYKKAKLSDKQILIPASSIKGAISHRTTFHYNKLKGNTIENGNGVEVVNEIFGEKKNSKKKINGAKGKILLSDCFMEDKEDVKTFDHVSIDRFTGGAIDGALFQEKTIAQKDEWSIEILLDEEKISQEAKEAFKKSLDDICSGMLPLGGMTTKGHGVFNGSWSKA